MLASWRRAGFRTKRLSISPLDFSYCFVLTRKLLAATITVNLGVQMCHAAPAIANDACSEAARPQATMSDIERAAVQSRPRPLKGIGPKVADKEVSVMTATEAFGTTEEFFEARGNVEMKSPSRDVLSDWMRYDVPLDTIRARGNVAIRSWQDLISGPELEYKRDTETGFMKSPKFILGLYKGRGAAEELLFTGPEKYRVLRGNYSTCADEKPAWRLEVGTLDIDDALGVGTAKDARVYIGSLPVAWLPQFSFPLKNDRKSGFLAPTYGTSGNRGLDIQLPYYFNLAPNYDATLTPRLMTKRGLMFNGQFRYLFDTPLGRATGEWLGEILPKDRLSDTTRRAENLRHTQSFSPNLTLELSYSRVSDPRYFIDLADYVAITSITTLPRDATLTYRNFDWTFRAKAQKFQTLQDPFVQVLAPYDRLPQLAAESPIYRFGSDKRFEAQLTTDLTRFEYPDSSNPSGYRGYGLGTLAYRYETPAGFVVPRFSVHVTRYKLNGQFDDITDSTRVIPISSIDAGLHFERNTNIFGTAFRQTLEPRAMFTYIPFRDQSKTPIFDTALADFNQLQLFSENRYVGNDRIGDAAQISVGVTSRLFDPGSQKERLRVTVGERFYFNKQRVNLGEDLREANASDLLVAAQGRVTDSLYLEASQQYNLGEGRTERYAFGLRYSPDRARTFNLNYRSIRELATLSGSVKVKQIDSSIQWPIYRNLYAVGRVNYSIADRRLTEGVLGLEYDGCCYVVRGVVQRLATSSTTVTNTFFLQLELIGLGRVGANPLDLLKRNIPGYSVLYDNPTSRRIDNVNNPTFTPWTPATP
jgi:LPS-assembly protein